jgi:FAD/FMN-containing dehydrogenase
VVAPLIDEESSMTIETTASPAAESLRGLCDGAVHLPGDPGFDDARVPWNVAVDQRPAAVAYPATTREVADIVLAARGAGLRVAAQGTGHNAGPLGALDAVVLVRTSAMTRVTIDPEARIARAEAGALWLDVVEAAAEHGLAALHGSSPDVGVVGYSLGGGMGWYGRMLGLATNSLTAVEIVTADGNLVRADAEHDSALFWALRGGGGSFGVVTAMEFRLFPIETAYAGWLVWDWADAEPVLRRWARWTESAPDEVTTSFRMLNVPPIPEMPEPFRGRKLAVIDGAVLGSDEEAAAILAPLRELAPELDTFDRTPAAALSRLHMDPEGPTPATSDTATLEALPDEAVDAFLSELSDERGSSLLLAELRQLGGALGRQQPGAGALSHIEGGFLAFAAAIAATPEMGAQGHADASRLIRRLTSWSTGSSYLNFAENPTDVRSAYPADTWQQLKAIRSMVDPDGVFVANHQVPRLYEDGRPTE